MTLSNTAFNAIETNPKPDTSIELYLDLLKRSLTRTINAKGLVRHTLAPGRRHLKILNKLVHSVLDPIKLELVQLHESKPEDYIESTHGAYSRAEDAETMLGLKQLDQMQACLTDVVERNIPGDVIEAGVWRGGMTIFMRGVLKSLGDNHRKVLVADSFEGLPDPDKEQDSFGWFESAMCVSLEEVKSNFSRYGLLDDQVEFIKGYFNETLPKADITSLSVLRVDADLYESTMDVLNSLYPKLSAGGYAIFDDYLNLVDCRRAIDEYRQKHNITDPIIEIDQRAVYWIKS